MITPAPVEHYNLYPSIPLGPGKIALGYDALAEYIVGHPVVVVDGYGGVLWDELRANLDAALTQRGVAAAWIDVVEAHHDAATIEQLVAPFLGGDDPLFGTRFRGELRQFFNPDRFAALRPDPTQPLTILYGCGAALAGWHGLLVYVDVPKNEIQYRSRTGRITNLGMPQAGDPKSMYKRFYFVDWVAFNQHKRSILPQIDLFVDGQSPAAPTIMRGADLRDGLTTISQNCFRVRPWFEPGPWGGQWLKQHLPQLPPAPNYAWSFELIVPENGLLFASDGNLLEVSFDCLMFHDHQAVLGAFTSYFGYEFPIRFDFLDTVDGGNLSVQCHPQPAYIRQHFGEHFTQDETYYILDCTPDARVYLGFQEQVEPHAFRAAVEHSHAAGVPLDVDRFVHSQVAHKHDLFLIPHGTIHCAGAGNLVLEISATPYIFTFKLYDWLRLGLDGLPRPLNIDRAFENLKWQHAGQRVRDELVAVPVVVAESHDWQCVHLATHPDHFYDVVRWEFNTSVDVQTADSPHVLMLVEGDAIEVQTHDMQQLFHYAETFVVPAAAQQYCLINHGSGKAKVVQAFLKPAWFTREEHQWIAHRM